MLLPTIMMNVLKGGSTVWRGKIRILFISRYKIWLANEIAGNLSLQLKPWKCPIWQAADVKQLELNTMAQFWRQMSDLMIYPTPSKVPLPGLQALSLRIRIPFSKKSQNIATGKTSRAITPYHFFNYLTSSAFNTNVFTVIKNFFKDVFTIIKNFLKDVFTIIENFF